MAKARRDRRKKPQPERKDPWFRSAWLHRASLVLLGAALLLPNLGNVYLWQDEAETALLARSVLAQGYPSAWDGKSVITQNRELEFNEDYVWTWSPWLQFYLTAGSFLVLGESTFAARLPFVILALASIALLHVHACRLTASRRVALLAGLLMTTSIAFLLHARQCRWYMAAVFATIWLLDSYLRMTERRRGGVLGFVVASFLLFHANFVVLAYVAGGIGAHWIVAPWLRSPRPSLRALLVAASGAVLLIAPWAFYAEVWARPNPLEEYRAPLVERVCRILSRNLVDLNDHFLPLPLAALVPWAWGRFRGRHAGADRGVSLLALVVLAAPLVLSALPWTYFRYLIVLVAPCSVLLALVLDRLFDVGRALGAAVLVLAVATNLFTLLLPPREPRSDLLGYLDEITHDFDGPNEGIVDYLRAHGRPNELVLTNYGQLPILFYTDLRAIGFGQDPRTAEVPDWIVIRRDRGHESYLRARARGYRRIVLDYPDTWWGNRPDPSRHLFRTATDAPRVVIYRRPPLPPRAREALGRERAG